MQTEAAKGTKQKNNISEGTNSGKCLGISIPPQRLLPNGSTVNFGNGPVGKSTNSSNVIGDKKSTRKKPINYKQSFNNVAFSSDSRQQQAKEKSEQSLLQPATVSRGGKNRATPKANRDLGPTTRANTLTQSQNQANKHSKTPRVAAKTTKYAGSSFHQSPSAVSLPKPSFL